MRYERGDKVYVMLRYNGSGTYGPDGNEGWHYVVKDLGTDLKLSRTEEGTHPDSLDWGVIVHKQRIKDDELSYWHRDRDVEVA